MPSTSFETKLVSALERIDMKKAFLLFPFLLLTSCGGKSNFVLGLGGENVPVGQYASKILEYYDISEESLKTKGVISYGKDVKEVTTQVKEGSVSAGIIYKTDAFSADLKVVAAATKEMCGQVLYPAALITNSKSDNQKATAKYFLDYLTTSASMSFFEGVGFTRVAEERIPATTISDNVEINVYAAASLTESLTSIKNSFVTLNPNVTVNINFGSSGTLQTQIEEGRDKCDLFISAGAKQMNALEEKSLLVEDSRFNILENQVVLSVPTNNPANLNSFDDLANKLKEILK